MSTLPAIDYRIGTFGTFRADMLARLVETLPGWRPPADGTVDYATAIIELQAYLSDVLTFYQGRIANEAFLPTATTLDSLQRLAELVGYRPAPGSAASTVVAFSVAKGATVSVPARSRLATRAVPGTPAVVFETDSALVATEARNAIPLATRGPVDQFAALSAAAVTPTGTDLGVMPAPPARGPSTLGTRVVGFRGIDLRLRPGRFLLVVDAVRADGTPDGPGRLREIVGVTEDRQARTTTVTWLEDTSYRYRTSTPAVYAFDVQAAPFGHDAPLWSSLSPYLTQTTVAGQANTPAYPTSWDTPPGSLLPASPNVALDRTVAVSAHTPATVSLAVLVENNPTGRVYQTRTVVSADQVSVAGFTMTGRVTALRLGSAIQSGLFPLRATLILAGTRRLDLYDLRPLADPVTGARLLLTGVDAGLATGDRIVVRSARVAESAVVETATPDPATGTTSVLLRAALQNAYDRGTTTVLANVVPASQGETVKQEILGGGTGAALQGFALRKKPLTYLPALDPEHAVASTLAVAVDGVRWQEAQSLVDAGSGARVYVVEHDLTGAATVRFGDTTARPSAGRDNVTATYRRGLGTTGNVTPDAVATLTDSRPGLRAVTNPVPSTGGTDPEGDTGIRANAPAGVRLLGRIVALDDYPRAATNFPGVAMARAVWHTSGGGRGGVRLTVAGPDRGVLDASALAQLRGYLDLRRDVNVPLRIVPFAPVPVVLTVVVDVTGDFGRRATVDAARQALGGYLSGLGFGTSVRLSAVYATVAAVPGVRRATVADLRPPAEPAGTVDDRIAVPDDGLAEVGTLTVRLGDGGFDDR